MGNYPYFEKLHNGNFYVNVIPQIVPLIFWCFFIYKFYYPFYRSEAKYSFVFLLLMLMPFIILILQLVLNKSYIFNNNLLVSPISWQSCLSLKDNDGNDNGVDGNRDKVFGVYSYECGASQIDYLQFVMTHFQNRFFYLNFTIFLLVLISQNFKNIVSTKFKLGNYHIIFISITLFFGTIGVLPSSFSYGYSLSLLIAFMFTSVLNMNIAAFLITLYSIYIKIDRKSFFN